MEVEGIEESRLIQESVLQTHAHNEEHVVSCKESGNELDATIAIIEIGSGSRAQRVGIGTRVYNSQV